MTCPEYPPSRNSYHDLSQVRSIMMVLLKAELSTKDQNGKAASNLQRKLQTNELTFTSGWFVHTARAPIPLTLPR